MEPELAELSQRSAEAIAFAQASLDDLLLPSRLWQFAIGAACFGLAWMLRGLLGPRMHAWMRGLGKRPKWQLRALIIVQQRLRLIFFVLLAWSATGLVRAFSDAASRSYLLALVATIATAWLAVSLAARLVRNPLLRRLVTWGLGLYVTLYFLDLLAPVTTFLDDAAIQFGDFRLTLLAILKAVLITALLFSGARMIAQTAAARIRDNRDISPSMRVLAVKLMQVLLYGTAIFLGLKAVGFDLTGLAVLSGAVGLGLGFGLQKVVSNLVSGVIILLDKSIKPGDVISRGDTFGWINALGARYVSVVTRDGKEYLIPNEDLITNEVVNWSHTNDFVRLDIRFGTSYGDDPHLVRKLAVDAAKSVDRVLTYRAPVCHVTGFGDSAVDYILRFWIKDPAEGLTNVRGAVFLALWDTFKANGVSIPFPQREVRLLDVPRDNAQGPEPKRPAED